MTHDVEADLIPETPRGIARAARRPVCNSLAGQLFGLVLAVLIAPGAATAGDAAAGRKKAVQCQACHGLDGLSKLPEAPHIAGQPEQYLVKAMNDYRQGARKHELMTLAARRLSEQDVADLAAYYSAIEITLKQPAQ